MYFSKTCKNSHQKSFTAVSSLNKKRQGFVVKKRQDRVGTPSVASTRKDVVVEILFRDSTNWCKTIVGNDARQLYPYSMCQAMPVGLYTRAELYHDSDKFKAHQNKTRSFESMVVSYFQTLRPQFKVESHHTKGTEKNIDASIADGFYGHCNTVFRAVVW